MESSVPPIIPSTRREEWKPVEAAERIETLDVLRGFALFGILTVNIITFSWPLTAVVMGHQFWETRADVLADWTVQFLAEGKFYPLFAFLFGLGAAIQMERAEACGASFARRFGRRLAVLLGIGLVHAILIWEGDILVWYALCGFLLLPFRRRQPKTLLIWAAICFLIPVLLIVVGWLLLAGLSLIPGVAESMREELAKGAEDSTGEIEETIRVLAQGTYAEVFVERMRNLMFMWLVGFWFVPTFFAMFLVGMYAGKRRIFQELEANVGLVRRVLVWGLFIGLPANLLYIVGTTVSDMSDPRFVWFISEVFLTIGGPVQGLAYAAAITLLLRRAHWKRRLRPIAAAGRMVLSNYLLQSLICTTIFYSYGFGLFGSVGRATGLGIVVVIYAAQVAFSIWWLDRFRFGPAEWLWRALTYGKWQPMFPR